MPCWEVNLISLDLTVTDPDLLVEALKTIQGIGNAYYNKNTNTIKFRQGDIDLDKGKLNIREDYKHLGNEIKRAYSLKAIEKVANKKKWLLKRQGAKIVAKKY